jgi:hypothetical protein
MNTTPAVILNVAGTRAWLTESSDMVDVPTPHQTWAQFLGLDDSLHAGANDLDGVAAFLATFADAAGVFTSSHAVEGLRVVTTRDGDARVEVALSTGVVLCNDDLGLAAAVGERRGVEAAITLLWRITEAANEAVALYRVAPMEV